MKTVKEISKLTGISVRTLHYYDEIGLFKPSALTASGYRLYDDAALETLQQILFFKELGFPLKEIGEILKAPDFDRIAAFQKQKKLFLLKRNRIDRLIQLLERLEKGETCMSFKEFDLSDYIHALEDFKSSQQENIVKYWGSLDNFEMFIQKIRDDEDFVARLAVQEFGSVEKYTEAMKHNLEHFSEIMADWEAQIPEELKEDKFGKLAAHKDEEPASETVQELVREILAFAQENAPNLLVGTAEAYCRTVIDAYSGDFCRSVFDAKNGDGASAFVAEAFRCYLEKNCEKNCPH